MAASPPLQGSMNLGAKGRTGMEKKKSLLHKQQPIASIWEGKVTRNDHNPQWAIKVEGPIYIKGKASPENRKDIFEKATIKLYASSEDWKKLWEFYSRDKESFSNQLWSDFIYPAILQTKDWRGSGLEKPNANLIRVLKTDASNLYSFFLFWMKTPRQRWPDYLKQLLKTFKDERPWSHDPLAFRGLDF